MSRIRFKALLAISLASQMLLALLAQAGTLPAPVVRTARSQNLEMKYAVQLPADHARARAPWPVVVFLHGSGEHGTDGLRQTQVGIGPAVARHPERFPAIVLMPQSPGIKWVENMELMKLVFDTLDAVVAEFNGDRSRLYLTGLSMGGGGTWVYGAQNAGVIAAMLPVQGFGVHSKVVPFLKSTPIWAFHGSADVNIPVKKSRDLVAAVRAGGNPNVRYTEFEGADHFIWDRVYDDPAVIEWLFAQRLGRR